LICATNRNLNDASTDGRFRRDLFYRICIFPITLPSLRERQTDISGMVEHILKDYGYTHFPIAPDVISLLQEYTWPGNIRELRNMLERALLLSQGEHLATTHFPGLVTTCDTPEETQKVVWNLEELEYSHIQRALSHFNGDKYETSSALGISLSSLYRKLEKIQSETA
jgi:transcriptional regulator with PAS, ATPase and Fis domain